MEWLNNPWIIGIGGGILSGFFVAGFSRYVLGKRENREYVQKLVSANQEVIYAMRPGISEGVVPPLDVVQAVINSTARKYGVDSNDLYSSEQIGEELIKQVIDSSFISSVKKAEFCKQINSLMKPEQPEVFELAASLPEVKMVYEFKNRAVSDYRQRMTTMISLITGIFAAMMTMLFVFTKGELETSRVEILLPTILAMMAIIMSTLFAFFYKKTLKQKREEEKKRLDKSQIVKDDIDMKT